MKKKSISNNEGITLIALVVSIVVMLILSAISLNATIGQNGIINQARKSKLKQEEAQVETDVSSALSALDMEYYQKVSSDSGISITSIYNIAGLSKYLNGKVNGFRYNKNGTTTIFYTTEKGSYTVRISQGQTTTYTGIRLEKNETANVKLARGEKITLSFDENTEIEWKTEKNDILQVDSKTGEVTRISGGTATINGYVKEDDGTETIITTVVITDENSEIAKDENTENSTSEMNIGASGENVKAYFVPREDGGKTLIIKGNGELAETINFTEEDKNSIKEIIFSDGITKITKNFNNLPNLEEVTIPKSVNSIATKAFADNSKFSILNYDAKECNMNLINERNSLTGVFVDKSPFYGSSISQVNIGENVKIIPKGFLTDQKLTSLSIPSNVTEIGELAFTRNSNLIELNLESGIINIKAHSFEKCNIKRLIIPKTIQNIGYAAFEYNFNLENLRFNTINYTSGEEVFGQCKIKNLSFEVDSNKIPDNFLASAHYSGILKIPEGITEIGYKSFRYTTYMKHVNLPSSLKKIGDEAFYYSAIEEITIPENVEYIGKSAFVSCNKLKTIYYNAIDASKSEFTTTEGNVGYCDFPFGGEGSNTFQVENIIIGDKVKVLPGCLFRKTAITTVTIPSNVERIDISSIHGDPVFCNCVNLQEIIIEKPEGTFNRADLTNLSSVKITYKQ